MKAYDRRWWRGYQFNERTIAMILTAEKILGFKLTIYQGSYNAGAVGASAGTHDGGGAADFAAGGDPKSIVRVLRNVGFAAWHRYPIPGVWDEHIHAIALGDKEAAPLAKGQMGSYRNGCDGLGDLTHPDPYKYRPDPIPVFDFAAYKLSVRLRQRVDRFTTRIKELNKTEAQLERQRARDRKHLKRLKTH